jgi:hypothetical protein
MICSASVSSRHAARAGRCHGARRTRTVSVAAVKAPSRLQEVAQGAAALAIAVGLALVSWRPRKRHMTLRNACLRLPGPVW